MKRNTSTLTSGNEIVPWLTAQGSLAYSPFEPPEKDYFFLYNFILPEIFNEKVKLRQHYWFGDHGGSDDIEVMVLRRFWEQARQGNIVPVHVNKAPKTLAHFEAPIAVFKLQAFREPHYLFIQ